MQTERCRDPGRCSVWDYEPAPEVWWGDGGIDALVWPKPYAVPPAEDRSTATESLAHDAWIAPAGRGS
jgi:hypothetical protein